MEFINRIELAEIIYNKINANKTLLASQFAASKKAIGYLFIDDLLPEAIAVSLYNVFPKKEEMVLKKSIKEDKYVAVQMNRYNPVLEEIIYAFQDCKIVDLIGEISQIEAPIPDEFLYAGGLSMMGNKQFLNPHLDNSHDKDRERWRVLNLLYYVTPDWKEEYGGNLELWPDGLQKSPTTIHSKFNRLVIMVTHNQSLHSVSPIVFDGFRCCISNYYFSKVPVYATDQFHVTSFRGRPEHKFTDAILKIDTFLRMNLRKFFKKGIRENPHVYKK
ncbi:2OG-Fe(II) oxygenase [Flavobacterium circumlabens]|uniref:2OG-Fe(II) oxygenase n=1 Tax=Flavobacterium circumlabens TaxID=2133765 RepID=A0A4Y7UBI7_9FLAO|nr:2OG-Fe(II) oxygenase [Flavobacterium circumlabens]TCN57472.1 Rps23 Pro-64 3,4-dihydroxylase Tpa1-like proline 4-hydroxylase [Flavobacterium circumlabens]TEB43785.1 2OG-Fe(II) oxygenase [Flavobacterium circumlabens]